MITLRKLTLYAAVTSIHWNGVIKVGPFSEQNDAEAIKRACARVRKERNIDVRLAYDLENREEFSDPRWYEVPPPAPRVQTPKQKQIAFA